MSQQEKPGITPQELCATLGIHQSEVARTLVSGGQIENFRKGWAKQIMADSQVAHWYRRQGFDAAESLCGQVAPIRWLYGQGNYPRCQHCIRVMSRRIKSGIET